MIEGARAIAAHDLEVAPADLAFANGAFRVRGTDRVRTFAAVARSFVIPWNAPTMRPCTVNETFSEDALAAAESKARATGPRVVLLRNAASCRACGETVVSWHDRHHVDRCACGATAVDAGAAYRKLIGPAVSEARYVVAYPATSPARR